MPTNLPPPIPGNGPTIAGSPWLIAETAEDPTPLDALDALDSPELETGDASHADEGSNPQ